MADPKKKRSSYNTHLPGIKAEMFARWLSEESKRQKRPVSMDLDTYDLMGFYDAGEKVDERNHGTDRFKKPYHPTFSNESQYHGVDEYYGGDWTDSSFVASPTNRKFASPEDMLYQMKEDKGMKLEYDKGKVYTQEDLNTIKKYATGGSIKDPENRGINVSKYKRSGTPTFSKSDEPVFKQGTEISPGMQDYWDTVHRRTKRKNFLNDNSTTLLTGLTEFRMPTDQEIEQGRSGWEGRANIGVRAAKMGMIDAMTGKAASKILPKLSMMTSKASGLGKVNNKILPKADEAVEQTLKHGETITINVPSSPWKARELPGLHLKSTMSDGKISNIIDKTGKINVEQALGIIGKESGGPQKVELVKKSLGNNIPQKMDYNDFRKLVQDELIPLERQFSTERSSYGLGNIGYKENPRQPIEEWTDYADRLDFRENIQYLKYKNQKDLLENQTLILGNKKKFGTGSAEHGNPAETLGHAHFLRDAETPDVLTVTQIQSDAFQGTNRTMPKALNKEQELKSLARMEELAKQQEFAWKNAVKNPTGGWNYPGVRETISDALHKKGPGNQAEYVAMRKAEIENFTQKQLLDKNHQERYLQELVDYAGKRGDVNKVRVPTSETAAKVQGYKTIGIDNKVGDIINLPNGEKGTITKLDFNGVNKPITVKVSETGQLKYYEIDNLEKYNNFTKSGYTPEHTTILKKYSKQPKTIKKLFGKEPKIVTDGKGNTWYEFDIPKKFKEGKGEIKAFGLVPPAAGVSLLNNSESDETMKKYAKGGRIGDPKKKSINASKYMRPGSNPGNYIRPQGEIKEDLQEYGIGGWLEDNGGNLMKTALGAGLSIAGMPQVGLPMAMSAGSDMLFGGDEQSKFRNPSVSKSSQMYQVPARGGMNLQKQPMRSEFTGNDHEQGGIPLSGIGVEVEDGEVRTGDTIHSKDIKITPAMLNRYGKRTGLKKGDRGKSVADIVKRADKKFEKREGDKWNDQARKIVQAGYEEMSNELADIYQIAQEMSVGMPQGNQMAEGGLDLESIMGVGDDLGNMPMVASAFGALNSFVTPPEKVDYQGADYAPTEVTPVRGNYDRIRRVYGNTRGRLNRLNPRGFQNNAAALASAEAESVGDMSSRVDEINAGNKNAASRLDSQTRSRTSMFNSQLSAKEAESNAANRGAKRSATEAYLSNFATQAGQKARDAKLYESQDRYMDMMDEHLQGLRDLRKGPQQEDLLFDDFYEDEYGATGVGDMRLRRFGGRLKKYRK